jgi:hypothetical protein
VIRKILPALVAWTEERALRLRFVQTPAAPAAAAPAKGKAKSARGPGYAVAESFALVIGWQRVTREDGMTVAAQNAKLKEYAFGWLKGEGAERFPDTVGSQLLAVFEQRPCSALRAQIKAVFSEVLNHVTPIWKRHTRGDHTPIGPNLPSGLQLEDVLKAVMEEYCSNQKLDYAKFSNEPSNAWFVFLEFGFPGANLVQLQDSMRKAVGEDTSRNGQRAGKRKAESEQCGAARPKHSSAWVCAAVA